ncbi:MAG: 50S ribosomal protein L3 [Planctomycetota bacterium]|nr:MAG: 50S ribosomal protein L3 [Planctomycetota bacterium]
MTKGLLGKKLGMTQYFEEDGTVVPCTVLEMGPCKVLQVKVKDSSELPEEQNKAFDNRGKRKGKVERQRRGDGYYALQLGFDERIARRTKKPAAGHVARSGVEDGHSYYYVKEIRFKELPEAKAGDEITVEIFEGVNKVDVTGTTKGRGWAGWIKRWNFRRQPMSHGTKKVHRHAGGLGRTYSTAKGLSKGHKMTGHYGTERVTIQSIDVVKVDTERNYLWIRGAVPGPRNGYVMVREAVKTKKKKQS